jgi:hypothetical protein
MQLARFLSRDGVTDALNVASRPPTTIEGVAREEALIERSPKIEASWGQKLGRVDEFDQA